MKTLVSLCALLCCAPLQIVHAGSAVWKLNPTTSDWTWAGHWTPKTVPNGSTDVATFAPSNVTNLSISAGVEVAGIVFNPDANAFIITNLPGTVLTVSGAGITNNSGLLQNFVNQEADTTSGELHFTNNATAGESVVYINQTPLLGGRSPLIQFEDSSSASSAQFYNQSGKQSQGGLIQFKGNSTAANGTFRNTGDTTYQVPGIIFLEQASAGQALFTNEGTAEGILAFYDTSTADHATMLNEEGPDSLVFFLDDSTAGNARFLNLADGATVNSGNNKFQTSYEGGDGNDLTLTVIP